MLPILAAVVLTASAPRIAVPGLDYVQLDQKKGDFFSEYLSQQLANHGFQVTTQKEIAAVLGMERQKQLLGCADDSESCLAELAGALGVDGMLLGSIARFEGEYVFTLKIISARSAAALAQKTGRVRGDSRALDWLSAAAEELANRALAAMRAAPAEEKVAQPVTQPKPQAQEQTALAPAAGVEATAPARSGGLRRWSWVPAVAAVGLAGGGTWFLVRADGEAQKLRDFEPQTGREASNTAERGIELQNTSRVLFGGAAVAALAAGAMFIWGAPADTEIALVPNAGGAGLWVSGSFE